MSNPFAEVRFDPGIIPRGVGGITYRTTIVRTHADSEYRNSDRDEWLFEGDVGEVLLNEKQTAYTIAFFSARRGKAEGFRYKYWGDYECSHEPLELSPTTTTQGVATPVSASVYQLQKRYSDAGDTSRKTIIKPVEGTVKIYVGGILQTGGYVIDYNQGYVYFGSLPGGSISWSGEFDLPVWFDTDTLPGLQVFHSDETDCDRELFRFESLPIIELPIRTTP